MGGGSKKFKLVGMLAENLKCAISYGTCGPEQDYLLPGTHDLRISIIK